MSFLSASGPWVQLVNKVCFNITAGGKRTIDFMFSSFFKLIHYKNIILGQNGSSHFKITKTHSLKNPSFSASEVYN